MDYGHRLEFGAFITPAAADPEAPVRSRRSAEAAGLDLVTFQDHPYQPAFLDTWTLMSFVAARTDSIRIAPNVLNVPLRPPAVLARAAASLDLLSGGRFDLALGAGGVLGRDRGDGRRAPHPRAGGHRARGGDRRHPRAVGHERAPRRLHRRAGTTGCTAPSADRAPLTTSRSGSAPTSRACSRSPGARATAGCLRSDT